MSIVHSLYAELMDRVLNPLNIIQGLAQLPLSEKCDKKIAVM